MKYNKCTSALIETMNGENTPLDYIYREQVLRGYWFSLVSTTTHTSLSWFVFGWNLLRALLIAHVFHVLRAFHAYKCVKILLIIHMPHDTHHDGSSSGRVAVVG